MRVDKRLFGKKKRSNGIGEVQDWIMGDGYMIYQ